METETIKQLDKVVKKGGIEFKQVFRNNYGCIYEEIPSRDNPFPYNYEVFMLRTANVPKTWKVTGKWENVNKYERYPKSKEWGSWAWTFRDYAGALAKLNEFTDKNESEFE